MLQDFEGKERDEPPVNVTENLVCSYFSVFENEVLANPSNKKDYP